MGVVNGDIVAFIRERLDEDEKQARYVLDDQARYPVTDSTPTNKRLAYPYPERVGLCVFHGSQGPERALRRVNAGRITLVLHTQEGWAQDAVLPDPALPRQLAEHECYELSDDGEATFAARDLCLPLRLLASEWSTHPDFRSEWTP